MKNSRCRIIYCNRRDPRVFVYKHEKYRWPGVTLNFAHPKSFVIMAATILSCLVMALAANVWKPWGMVLVAAWAALVVVYAFRGAAEDLKRHPGNRSCRS